MPSLFSEARLTRAERVEVALSLSALVLFVTAYFIRFGALQQVYRTDGWVTGDWLINYSGGFVRRGLIGQVALIAHRTWAVDPVSFVIASKSAVCGLFCVLLLALASIKRIGLVELILFLSPWSLMFDLMWSGGMGRKELFFFAAFALYCVVDRWAGRKGAEPSPRWAWGFFLVTLPLLTLIHEGLFFFLQFFLVFICTKTKPRTGELRAFGAGYALAGLTLLLSVIFRGSAAQVAAICANVASMGVAASICDGGITSLAGYSFTIHSGYFAIFLPLAAYTLVPIVFYAMAVLDPAVRRRFVLAFLSAILPTIPLYVLGADWGRWIHVVALVGFLTLIAHKKAHVSIRALPAIVVFFILVTPPLYLFGWRLPNFIGDNRTIFVAASSFERWTRSLFGF